MSEKILIDTGPSERGVHRLETAAHCLQLYSFGRNLNILSSTLPLVRGTLGHIGLAHHYARMACAQRGIDPELYYDPLTAIDVKVQRMVAGQEPGFKNAQKVVELVQAAVLGYIQFYAVDRMKIFAVENVVESHFEGYRLTQRFDLVTESLDGKYWVYDHKFVGKILGKSVTRYTLSPQFLEMYHQASRIFGARFGGLRINLVGVGDGDSEPSFKRATPEPAPFALQQFPAFVRDTEEDIARCESRDPWHWPKRYGEQTCVTPYGPCPATEACRWGPTALTSPEHEALLESIEFAF